MVDRARFRGPAGQSCAPSSGFASKEQRFPRKETCLQIYSYRVNTQQDPARRRSSSSIPWCVQWEEDLTQLYRAYVERKQRCSILDYDDLLLYWHAMMAEARLAQHVSAHFDHMLVDEYQDTNRLQAEILHALQARRLGPGRGGRRRAGRSIRSVPPRSTTSWAFRIASRRAPKSSRWRRTIARRSRCWTPPTR